jgi:hypothetical protein
MGDGTLYIYFLDGCLGMDPSFGSPRKLRAKPVYESGMAGMVHQIVTSVAAKDRYEQPNITSTDIYSAFFRYHGTLI